MATHISTSTRAATGAFFVRARLFKVGQALSRRHQGEDAKCDSAFARPFKIDHAVKTTHLKLANCLSAKPLRADWAAAEAFW